jgi:hypothetical protein
MTNRAIHLFVFCTNVTLFNVKENTMNDGLGENKEAIES